MLEEDYLRDSPLRGQSLYSFKDPRLKALNEYSSQLIRELIIPELNLEVNTSKRYAPLRQVYYSLILAQWFKARFKPALIDSRNLTNLTSKDNWSKQNYFKAYQASFKDGEYNIQQPVYTPYGQSIRSYFSGGMNLAVKIALFGATGQGSSPVSMLPAVSSLPASVRSNGMIGITIAGRPAVGQLGEIKIVASSPAEKKGASSAMEGKTEVPPKSKDWIKAVRNISPNQRLILEIGPGWGEVLEAMGERNTSDVFIGVEPVHHKIAEEKVEGMPNVFVIPQGVEELNDSGLNKRIDLALLIFPSLDIIEYRLIPAKIAEFLKTNGELFIVSEFKYYTGDQAYLAMLFEQFIRDLERENFGVERQEINMQAAPEIIKKTAYYRKFENDKVSRIEIIRITQRENLGKDKDKPVDIFNKRVADVQQKDMAGTLSAPSSSSINKTPGGIDFRSLPIVTQAVANLKGMFRDSPLQSRKLHERGQSLEQVNLDEEWRQIQKMVDAGIRPSAERLKEYVQVSCVKGDLSGEINKVILCISDILRQEEESCCATDPVLRDILVVLESGRSAQELKQVFLGTL